ncbi:uncharacterized protein LOC129615662 [Condylostylus longicornis]|uniref:uncharacterized protein LOC129615662 n=1 Tax=Condylostylus longicornis TaxID=2530218 RepID=UPI00244DE32B|nr:uncharacterized protein LOC129615662 [Condylostylus longicornis]
MWMQRKTRLAHNKYKQKRRIANQICKRKMKQALKKNVEQIEKDFNQRNVRDFYRKIKMQRKGFQHTITNIKDKNGTTLTEEAEIVSRWKEYFSELYNMNGDQPNYSNELEIFSEETGVEIPEYDETVNAILKLKDNKATGEDTIAAEMFKAGDEWRNGIIMPIHKKGIKTDCQNYRGITLLNVTYKILAAIIARRLKVYSEGILTDYQCGFREQKSTVDQIFYVRQKMEKCAEYNIDLHMVFTDFKQATNEPYKNEDIVRFIKSQRLRWLGHLNRMDESRAPKRIFEARPLFQRNIGRPRLKWKDDVAEDFRKMNITNWQQLTTDREGWRRIVNQARAHIGLVPDFRT